MGTLRSFLAQQVRIKASVVYGYKIPDSTAYLDVQKQVPTTYPLNRSFRPNPHCCCFFVFMFICLLFSQPDLRVLVLLSH